ncbi:MAG: glycogen phosphorylase, partial [Sphingobium sp.]
MTATGRQANFPKPSPRPVDADILAQEIVERLTYRIGKNATAAKPHDWLHAVILAIRDRVIDAWIDSTQKTYEAQGRRVYYLSLEFLIGRLMRDAA